MKIVCILFISFFLITLNVSAKKTKVQLDKCVDGDTAVIIINDIKTKVRFLAVDSPEIDIKEPYSKEALDFTCELLTNAKNIYLEFDNKSDEYDKYDRLLAWVWADDTLVQQELVKNGLAKVAYLYNDYKYNSELKNFEIYAKENKLGIWGDYKEETKPKDSKKKESKSNKYLDRLNKSYEIIVLILAGILALITLYIKRKK